MIPKIIHYCWFGRGKLPRLTRKCIKSWKNKLPDYELRIWNEDNFDIQSSIPYVKEAYAKGKYAFVSDYVRLYALYNYGGIYLDTDVEVLKSLDVFLQHNSFMGWEDSEKLSTAIIGTQSHCQWIGEVLDLYSSRKFIREDGSLDMTTNVVFITDYLKSNMRNEIVTIFPIDFFSPKSWSNGAYNVTDNTYTIHYFAGTWHSFAVRSLSKIFTNETVANLAGIKERLQKMIKR